MVGISIRELRLRRGMTLGELSEKSGVSKSYLSYIERGVHQNPSYSILTRIADTLNTPLEELMKQSSRLKPVSIDEDWLHLLREAIAKGMRKDDLLQFIDSMEQKEKAHESS
ncbi:helix-turn-helix domain-containing protein [Bacillus fonticola]|uniref:helix-turn-helix domain-containing protein n=1 Tax=Bacillus fonticola TaxID=2728853 RepID=UPI0014732261|nr:helix-turn-helix transcriptional regulator [Bacillus fonticola]